MKRVFVFMTLFAIVLAGMVLAQNVAVVVEMPDGTVNQQCVNVDDGTSAYDILAKTKNTLIWSSPSLYGHALCKVNGVGDDVAGTVCNWGNEFWSFFIYDSGWKVSPVGFDGTGGCWNKDYGSFMGHYCGEHGAMIGLARVSTSTNSSIYQNEPPVVEFSNICGLAITDIEVKVAGEKDKNLEDGDKIGEKAKPGDSVEFSVEVSNLFSQDIEIQDVVVTITIEDIDDGDELEEEADEFDLKDGKDKSVDLNFEVPMIVDEEEYTVLIEVEGDGDDGVTYRDQAELTLEVKKDKHRININEFGIAPAVLGCDRRTTATIEMINLGREDEDEVAYEIRNDFLGLLIKKADIELDEGDEDDSIYRESMYLDFSDAKPGTYDIIATSLYDATKKDDTATYQILVEKCEPAETEITGDATKESPDPETTKDEAKEEAVVVTQPVTEYKYAEEEEVLDTTMILLIVGIVVVVILIGLLLSVAFRKR
ncbi:hypothetical protein JXA85_07950 [Candidatus Woesearchaeota archaeon]|nr:hypothetical protein [Candidatus Woesearchaeota archaeon]